MNGYAANRYDSEERPAKDASRSDVIKLPLRDLMRRGIDGTIVEQRMAYGHQCGRWRVRDKNNKVLIITISRTMTSSPPPYIIIASVGNEQLAVRRSMPEQS